MIQEFSLPYNQLVCLEFAETKCAKFGTVAKLRLYCICFNGVVKFCVLYVGYKRLSIVISKKTFSIKFQRNISIVLINTRKLSKKVMLNMRIIFKHLLHDTQLKNFLNSKNEWHLYQLSIVFNNLILRTCSVRY